MHTEDIIGLTAVYIVSFGILSKILPQGYLFLNSCISFIVTYAMKYIFFRYKGPRRRMSVLSAQLMSGPYPPQLKAPDPIINAFVFFKEAVNMKDLNSLIVKHLLHYERLSSIPVIIEKNTRVWQHVHVNPENHIYKHIAENASDAHDIMTEIAARPLKNPLLPLWEFHLIVNKHGILTDGDLDPFKPDHPYITSDDQKVAIPSAQTGVNITNFQPTEGATVRTKDHILIFRVHHAIGDGVSLVSLFMQFLKDSAGIPLNNLQERFVSKNIQKPTFIANLSQLFNAAMSFVAMSWVDDDTLTSFNPNGRSLKESDGDNSRQNMEEEEIEEEKENGNDNEKEKEEEKEKEKEKEEKKAVVNLKTSTKPHTNPHLHQLTTTTQSNNIEKLNAQFSYPSSFVFVPTISLETIKELKNIANVSVNDILIAILAGAIRRYCISQDDDAFSAKYDYGRNVKCHMILPIALPRSIESLKHPTLALRNLVTVATVDLPVGIANITERLDSINKNTSVVKSSLISFMFLFFLEFIHDVIPINVLRRFSTRLLYKQSAIFSNVPGPNVPVIFAGREVTAIQAGFPNIVPHITAISYNGGINIGFTLDAVRIKNAQSLANYVIDELKYICQELSIPFVPFVSHI